MCCFLTDKWRALKEGEQLVVGGMCFIEATLLLPQNVPSPPRDPTIGEADEMVSGKEGVGFPNSDEMGSSLGMREEMGLLPKSLMGDSPYGEKVGVSGTEQELVSLDIWKKKLKMGKEFWSHIHLLGLS